MIALTKVQSRILALALLILVLGTALWLMVYPMVSLHLAQSDEMARKEIQIAGYEKLAESQETLQEELASLRRRNPAATYYVAGDTPALASAKMQQYLKQVVERNGGELISTQIVNSDEESEASSSSLKVHLRADVDAAAQIVYVLESGRPLLFIDDLSVSARRVRGTTAGAPPLISLDLNFELTGYLQEGA